MANIPDFLKDKSSKTNTNTGKGGKWSDVGTKGGFFGKYEIKSDRWNKLYPYQLMVIDIRTNSVVTGSKGTNGKFTFSSSLMHDGSIFSYTNQNLSDWVFTMPITPQQLRISTLFAVNNTATARGIVEEHNGVKYKQISAMGTTGIWPKRFTVGMDSQKSSLETIFAGSIETGKNILEKAKRLNDSVKDEASSGSEVTDLTETGYYQAMLMGDFLERYAEAKKDPRHKHWRLCFNIPKQNKAYIVTPEVFTLKQDNTKPNQYLWEIKLMGYARVDINAKAEAPVRPDYLKASNFAKYMEVAKSARSIMADSISLIKSVQTDFRKPFEAIRQVILMMKSVVNTAYTLADFPNALAKEIEYQSRLNASLVDSILNLGNDNTKTLNNATTQTEKTAIITSLIAESIKKTENGTVVDPSDKTNDLNQVQDSPEEFPLYYDSIQIDNVELSPEQTQAISDEIQNITYMTIDSINTNKGIVKDLHTAVVNKLGLGDNTFSNTYKKPSNTPTTTEPTIDDLELLQAMMDVIQVMDDITATKNFDNKKKEDSLTYVSTLANNAGINFDLPKGKKLVPIPFGLTMEEMSARFLGDPNRWTELATLNNLRSPYIDEDGFIYSMLSNAQGRQFNITNINNELFIGQKISLSSSTVPLFIRVVTAVEKIGDGNYLITVDGNSDLGKLKLADNAKMQGYLPGTTNSQNRLYIPVNTQGANEDEVKSIPNLEQTQINKLAQVDWLLTDSGDLAINSVGDVRLATGITNLLQAMKMKLLTKKRSLIAHLDYGLSATVGSNISDIDTANIISDINNMVLKDPRFDGLERADIVVSNNTISIVLGVKISGQNGVVPVSFNLN